MASFLLEKGVHRILSFVAFAGVVAGCNSSPGGEPSAPPPTAPKSASSPSGVASAPASSASAAAVADEKKTYNVILITMDAVRADMPWQGYKRDIAPNLTKLAAEGVVYEDAYSVSSYTAKSVASFLSGRYPRTLYRDPSFFTKYSKGNTFLAEILHDHGVHTIGVQGHMYFDHGKNLGQGFDVWRQPKGLDFDPDTDRSITSPDITTIGTEVLGDPKNTNGRFFAWFHYGDPHDKYLAHAEAPSFGKSGRDLYDAEIWFTDSYIQKLLDFCATQPWWKDTIVIVSADHGEAFGEHKQYFHAFALWENLVRVPLIVKGPGIAPQHVTLRRSQIDLAPTVLELVGLPPDPGLAGKSLAPELFGKQPFGDREPILLDLPADTHNPMTRGMLLGEWKLIENPGPQYWLFHVTEDPGELKELSTTADGKTKLEEMKKRFDEAWAPYPYVAPWPGAHDMVGGSKANGPYGPPGWGNDPDADAPGGKGEAKP
jgi:choline-sulfatase